MCGIAGLINFSGQPVDRGHLDTLHMAMAHRGPDGHGVYCHQNVGLVHRRLAIIDPHAGIQPFYSNDKSIVLSYNGEVYNYVEIRKELAHEFEFRTESDTEVILNAYQKWGMGCLERLRGMFAFALLDTRESALYLVRDRIGIKPLYYYYRPECLIFASELLPILQMTDVRREINPEAVSGYFRYQYVPTPLTIYKDINKLEPGHFLKFDVRNGKVEKHNYWELHVAVQDRSEADWIEELNAALEEAIRIYVRSDVPFGAFLSGGVDSSLVTALMAQHLDEPVRTFSIGFNERAYSELAYASEASLVSRTNHHERIVSSELGQDVLGKLVRHFGEPFGDSSAIPTYYVSQEAASEVKMVLSGDGGDELFGGYLSYQTAFMDHMFPPARLPAGVLNLAKALGPGRLKTWAANRLMTPQQKHDAARQIFRDDDLPLLLKADMLLTNDTPRHFNGYHDPVTSFQLQDVRTYLVDDILTKVDRASMANSLEVRVPLLDHKLVELAFAIPLSLKIRYDQAEQKLKTKYLLKKSAARFYQDSFLERPKMGFGIPVVEWCRGTLRPVIQNELCQPNNQIFEWLDFNYVQHELDSFFAGSGNVSKVWILMMFALWMRDVHINA